MEFDENNIIDRMTKLKMAEEDPNYDERGKIEVTTPLLKRLYLRYT